MNISEKKNVGEGSTKKPRGMDEGGKSETLSEWGGRAKVRDLGGITGSALRHAGKS